ncbi:MAG: RNA signal recognition particle [Methylobacter sp.]|nr:MAG: RNA signal recognition particle [Methylobacter sp.]
MSYVDGFVLAVPTANKQLYLEVAKTMAAIFKEYGALKIVECWGDDVPEGEHTSFPMAVKCQPDETVVFSWILWPSRQTRDESMAKAMADPRMCQDHQTLPFDGKRVIFGGFDILLEE